MPRAKPYSGQVEPLLAAQLLNSSGQIVNGALLGDALLATTKLHTELVRRANEFLEQSAFAKIIAEDSASKMGRRGLARIHVSPLGEVVLTISYEESNVPVVEARPAGQIPPIKELRAMALRLGVDVSRFGIKRREMWVFLQKMAARSPSAKTVLVAVQDEDRGPMSAGPDELKVSAPLDKAPSKRRGFIKTGDALAPPVVVDSSGDASERRSLRQRSSDSQELDIVALLNLDPSKT